MRRRSDGIWSNGMDSLNDGLIVHYEFSGNVNDSKGLVNGTIVGGTWNDIKTTDKRGDVDSAIELNGSSEYITVSGLQDYLLNAGTYSLSLWFNSTINTNGRILETFKTGGSSRMGIQVASTKISAGYYNGSAYIKKGTGMLINTWYNVVMMLTGGAVTLYVNNVEATDTTTPLSTGNANGATIGATVLGTIFFNGKIDNIRIYNRILTANEIKFIYDNYM